MSVTSVATLHMVIETPYKQYNPVMHFCPLDPAAELKKQQQQQTRKKQPDLQKKIHATERSAQDFLHGDNYFVLCKGSSKLRLVFNFYSYVQLQSGHIKATNKYIRKNKKGWKDEEGVNRGGGEKILTGKKRNKNKKYKEKVKMRY